MIIVLKPSTAPEQLLTFTEKLKNDYGVRINRWDGVHSTVLGLIGDTTQVDIEYIEAQDIVESVKRVQEPYKKANRKFHPENTTVRISDTVTIGDGSLHIMAGPCSVESEEQIVGIAKSVQQSGATLLRGGAFKPRTSPYAFQGLKSAGLDLLKTARKETGLPIVTEIMRVSHIDMFENVDVIQVGARNMQNFELLKELGKTDKPILLKRGLSACSASAASAPMRPLRATPSTSRRSPSSNGSRTCPLSSIRATPPARAGWWSRWRWQRWRQAPTA